MVLLQWWRQRRAAKLIAEIPEEPEVRIFVPGYEKYVSALIAAAENGTRVPRRWQGPVYLPVKNPNFDGLEKAQPISEDQESATMIVHKVRPDNGIAKYGQAYLDALNAANHAYSESHDAETYQKTLREIEHLIVNTEPQRPQPIACVWCGRLGQRVNLDGCEQALCADHERKIRAELRESVVLSSTYSMRK